MKSKFFTATKISDYATVIDGMGGERCYLIEGSDRALLIDGLTGVGSLKAFVRELTDKPVIIAATHGHIDHIGAAWEYGEVYINPDDIALMYSDMCTSTERRYGFVCARNENPPAKPEDVIPYKNVKTYPIYDGDIFDLGGVELEVIAVPGHTYGTVVFLDRAARVIYSGDACNSNTLLCLPGSTSIEEYRASLEYLKTYQGLVDKFWGGHGAEPVPVSIIDDAIAMADRILKGEDEAVPCTSVTGSSAYLGSARGENFLPVCGGYANIMYSPEKLHRAAKTKIKDTPRFER